ITSSARRARCRRRPIRPLPMSTRFWPAKKKKSCRCNGNRMSLPDPASRFDAASLEAPLHVAIIMDGNGRWAAARGLPRREGHRQGVEALRRAVRAAGELGIKVLTIYSFSAENWSRPAEEISDLMGLLKRFVRK